MSSKDLQIIEVEEVQAEIETAPTKSEEKMTFSNSLSEHPLNHASSFQSRLKDQHVVSESEDQPEDQGSLSQNKLFIMTEYVPEDKVQPKDQSKDQFEDQEFLRQYQEHVMNVEECVLEDENQPENQPEKQPKAEPEDQPEDQGCLPQNHQYEIKIVESFSEHEQLISEDQEAWSQNQQFSMKFEEFVPEAEDQPEKKQPKDHLEDKESLPQNKKLNLKVQESLPRNHHVMKVEELAPDDDHQSEDLPENQESLPHNKHFIMKFEESLPKDEQTSDVQEFALGDKQSTSVDSKMPTENLSMIFESQQDDKIFPRYRNKKRKRMHKKDVGYCPDCSKQFSSMPALKYHLLQHNNPKKFLCKLCDRFLPLRKQTLHSKLHAKLGDKFKCKICDKVLVNEGSLANHSKIHEGFNYRCKYCPRSFFQKSNLNVHIEKMHKFKSKICDKVLVNKGSLINPNDLKYRCRSCPKSFNQEKNLNVHVEKMHSSWSLKP